VLIFTVRFFQIIQNQCNQSDRIFRAQETAIKPDGIATTMYGLNLYPLVSSSKNLSKPALDAGKGADFLLLITLAILNVV
jgi:hypothetical protein